MRLLRSAIREGAEALAPLHRHLPEGFRQVALTFDDGPDAEYTPQVLDVLAERDTLATFFLVGKRVDAHPDLARRIAAAGHAVGSHTWSHRDGWTLSWRELLSDYRRGRAAVERALGRRVRLFRPPKGHASGRTAVAARLAGFEQWLWSVDGEDWRPGIEPCEIVVAATEGLQAGDVVLLHDGIELPLEPRAEDRSSTVAALPELIERVRARRLVCVRLEDASV